MGAVFLRIRASKRLKSEIKAELEKIDPRAVRAKRNQRRNFKALQLECNPSFSVDGQPEPGFRAQDIHPLLDFG